MMTLLLKNLLLLEGEKCRSTLSSDFKNSKQLFFLHSSRCERTLRTETLKILNVQDTPFRSNDGLWNVELYRLRDEEA